MTNRIRSFTIASLFLGAAAFAGEGDKKTVIPAAETDRWKLVLSSPGWIAGLSGDAGVNGIVTHADVNPSDLLRHADMIASLRGELSKGRFGLMSDFIYMSLSDGIGTNTIVKKIDVQMDQVMGDLALRWRVLEGERGWLDLTAGVRYTNLYQKAVTQANAERLGEVSTELVDAVGRALREAIAASDLGEIIAGRLSDRLATGDPRGNPVPIVHLRGRDGERHRALVFAIIDERRAELQAAQQAARQAVGAARAAAQQRVAEIKKDLAHKIADALEDSLDARVSRTDDWFDPHLGLRGRYHFNDRFYFTAMGDVGGFGVGSEFTWQAEGAFGCYVTPRIFTEVGYRALGVDYDEDGLTYDMITHGAQITMGIEF
jgi:hypothetical protein